MTTDAPSRPATRATDFSRTQALLGSLDSRVPAAGAFRRFSKLVWGDGALGAGHKQLVAVAAAHATRCHYCIEYHARAARRLGLDLDEVLEAAFVTSAVEAHAAGDAPGDPAEPDSRVARAVAARRAFVDAAFAPGLLEPGLKHLVAAAVAVVKERPDLAAEYAATARAEGVGPDQLTEATLVAQVMKAGAAYAHTAGVVEAWD